MRSKFVITAVTGLLLVTAALAQDKSPNFSGHWELDVSKSKLDERARIQTMTLDVTQTAADIRVGTKTTRAPRPEGVAPGGQGGGGQGRGGGFGGGDSTMTFTLDGKETKIQQDSPMGGQIPVTLQAKIDSSTLHLSSSRTFTGPNGEITTTTKDTWTLSSDGNTLTVEREQTTPRGTNSSTMVFIKK